MSRGIQRERDVRRVLESEGWWTARAAGSFGDADVIALKVGSRPQMIEVGCQNVFPPTLLPAME